MQNFPNESEFLLRDKQSNEKKEMYMKRNRKDYSAIELIAFEYKPTSDIEH